MNDASATRIVILIVEDNPEMREFVTRAVGFLGHTTVEAGDGMSALNVLADRHDIRLMLTDVMLPGGLNGAELAREARRQRPDLKILFMSGYADTAIDAEELNRLGATVLAKPFRVRQLAERLSDMLNQA